MLIFSRKANQSFMIGDNIKVTLLSSDRGHAKIGIEAPKDTPVHRQEIYEAIQKEKGGAKVADR